MAIHASFACCRVVRFSGFFHSAYRAPFNALARPVARPVIRGLGTLGKLVLENNQLRFTKNEVDMIEFSRTAKQGFAKPDVWDIEIPFENAVLPHAIMLQNFVNAILAASNTILEKQIEIEYKTGTSGSERIVNIQFAGHTMQAPELFQSRNGVLSVDLVFDGVYNPTMSNWLKISTSSALATV